MNTSNKHKSSASQGDHQIHMTLSGQPKSQQINMTHQFQNNSGLQNMQTGSQNQTNMSNILSQKSQRINPNHSNIMAGPNSSTTNHSMNITRANNRSKDAQQTATQASSLVLQKQYETFSQKFNSRQPLGSQNTTPIGAYAASFTHGNAGQQNTSVSSTGFNGVQHPKIISGQMRQSVGANNLKQYTNKENVGDIQMRCNSGGPTSTSHQQNTNSGSQLSASRHHQISKGQNSSRGGGNISHGRNFYPGQQSGQNMKQSAFQMNQAIGGTSSTGIGPALNYSQQNHNYNPKYSQSNIGPQVLNRTSPQSFLRSAMSNAFPHNQKGNSAQYSSNKNVGGGGVTTPMNEITAVANGVQNSLANTSLHIQQTLSSQSNKQAQLGGRLSHPSAPSGGITLNNSKANLADLNLKLSQKSMKQGMPGHESSQCSGAQSGSGSNRVPQPSIIASATGNMNQILRQQSPKNDDPFKVETQNYHSQQQQTQQQIIPGAGVKGDKQSIQNPTSNRLSAEEHEALMNGQSLHHQYTNQQVAQEGSRISVHQNVQAPMIIEKKFNLVSVTSNPSLLPNQSIQIASNTRYGSRESAANTSGNNMNISMMHSSKLSGNMKSFEQMNTSTNGQRNSSHTNNNTTHNNMLKQRLRSNGTVSGGNNNAQQRGYQVNKGNNTSTGMRSNIEISSRLQEPFSKAQVTNSVNNSNSSFVMQNKYNNLHQKAHESNRASGGLVASNINKSGQNLNNNHQRSIAGKSHQSHGSNVPHTQRSGRVNGNQSTIGGTSGRSSLKQHAGMITNQSSHQKNQQVNNFGKQQISGVTQRILKEHEAKHDKENKQRLSNKQSSLSQGKSGSSLNQISKRNTSDNISRQSIVAMQGQNHKQRNNIQQQNSTLGMVNGQRSHQSSNKIVGSNNNTMSNGTAGHHKSKNSTENEHTSSQGNASTSQRRNSSQHNTNRSNTAIQSSGASRTLQRLNEQAQQSKMIGTLPTNAQMVHDQSHHSTGSQQHHLPMTGNVIGNNPSGGPAPNQAQQSLLRRKSARDLNQNSKSMIQYANQLDNTMPEKALQIQNFQVTEKPEQVQSSTGMGEPTMHTSNAQQPQEQNDKEMHIEREEDETTMGEGQVGNEGETTKDGQELPVVVQQPEVQSAAVKLAVMPVSTNQTVQLANPSLDVPPTLTKPRFDTEKLKEVVAEMDQRRKDWLKQYKTNLDLNDVLEIRNPQSVIEFVPEILVNLKKEELNHMYPVNFLDRSLQMEISDKYRQYLVDWLAELHYKFKMWPETLFVCVGLIDKTLQKWDKFRKADLQCLGITALHIAGKYEEIYPPELRTILQVIDNAVTRAQVCQMESEILQRLDFDLVWPSVLRFMQRYACISNFSNDQHMIANMFCDFILLNTSLLRHKPSLLGAVAIYATNKITNRKFPWNASLRKCTLGIQEEDVKHLANELFYFVKTLESSSLKTMFRKYELQSYLGVVNVLQKIQMPNNSSATAGETTQQQQQINPIQPVLQERPEPQAQEEKR